MNENVAYQENENDVKARAAWHYYVEGQTQERIAEMLGVGRVKVHRLLSAAREDGIVQFKIRNRLKSCLELQSKLVDKFGLAEAIVVPSAYETGNAPRLVGHAAGEYLSSRISPGDVVGIGWGRTIKAAISQIPERQVARSVIVSLLGGLTRSSPLNPAGAAVELARRLNAECYVLPVPVFADEPEHQTAFMSQRSIQDVLHWAQRANMAIISTGSFSRDNPIADYGFIRPHEWDELGELGAVGDVLGHFIKADGSLVSHPVNERACSIPLADLAEIPSIVLLSGGHEKTEALRAALSFIRVTTLVTDEDAARGLLSG
ncbi:MAG: sugar-binding transcriptional regulator [Pseudomonadota bacterium]